MHLITWIWDLNFEYCRFIQFGTDQNCHCGASDCRGQLGKPMKKQKTSEEAVDSVPQTLKKSNLCGNFSLKHAPVSSSPSESSCLATHWQNWAQKFYLHLLEFWFLPNLYPIFISQGFIDILGFATAWSHVQAKEALEPCCWRRGRSDPWICNTTLFIFQAIFVYKFRKMVFLDLGFCLPWLWAYFKANLRCRDPIWRSFCQVVNFCCQNTMMC